MRFVSKALHTGTPSELTLRPAPANAGITFHHRNDCIPATFENVADVTLCTTLRAPSSSATTVSSVEHLLAALSAAGVDNVQAHTSSAELPIMDGSAWAFTLALKGQVVPLNAAKRLTIVRRAVRVDSRDGKAHASLWPLPGVRSLDLEVMTFVNGMSRSNLGTQRVAFTLSEGAFRRHVARARTFWSRSELERWRKKGLILGGGMDNSLLYEEGGKVLNSDGLRYSDEICRHLAVDCIGDLRLGGVVLGRYTAVRPAHWLNVELLRKLYRDPENYVLEGD
ncbi:unnamed protein product [Agarophyton chilense]